MRRFVLTCIIALFLPASLLAGMSEADSKQETAKSTEKTKKIEPRPITTAKAKRAIASFHRVSARFEPVAESICRSFHANKSRRFCDFQIKVRNDGNEKSNAFQTIGKDGRPVITFNINMLLTMRNDDEIAFVLGHEAGHQIAEHIAQMREHEAAGALLGSFIIADDEGEKGRGKRIGSALGRLAFSKEFELEADIIAAHITDRAGFNARRGSRELKRMGGSSAWYSTHPPSYRRLEKVQHVLGKIRAAKARGKQAPIVW